MSITINGSGDINATGNDIELNSTGTTDVTLALGGGKVGIGTATPSNYYAKDLVVAAPDEGGITVVSDTTHSAYLMFADGTSGADQYRGQIFYDHNVDRLGIAANGSTRLLVDSDGLKFNGDTAAANALDDYEEGTWTPTSVTGSINSYAYADYTKIGNTVNLHVAGIRLSDTTTASTIKISGLPFTPNSAAMGAMMIRFAGTTQAVSVYLGNSGTALELVHTTNSGSWVYLQHSSLTSSSCDLHLSITYQTAA